MFKSLVNFWTEKSDRETHFNCDSQAKKNRFVKTSFQLHAHNIKISNTVTQNVN